MPRRPSRLLALGTLPVAATVWAVLLALHLVLVTLGNITDFGTNLAFVRHVLAMDTTFHDPALMWRSSPTRSPSTSPTSR